MKQFLTRLQPWRWWIAAALVIIVTRALLPLGLRHLITSQASSRLHTQVDLEDVDLGLLHGDIVLYGFALHALPSPENPAPAPLISWKRFAVSLHWWPLVHHTIELREIALDDPHVAVDRLKSGKFSFEPVLAAAAGSADTAAASPAPATDAAAAATPWKIGIDSIALSGGAVTFRDFSLPESEPLEVDIPDIEVNDIGFTPDVYGKASESHIAVKLDQGALDLTTQSRIDGSNLDVDSRLSAHGLPVRRARLYVPGVGWSDLKGELDTELHLRFVTGTTTDLSGSVALRDLSITVPTLPDHALAWKSFAIRIDEIDAIKRVARIGSVDLDGLWLALRAQRPADLPVFERALSANSQPPPSPVPGADLAPTGAIDAPPSQAPWQWSVAQLRVHDSNVRLVTDASPVDVAITAALDNISLAPDPPVQLDVHLVLGDASIALKGTTRLQPPGLNGNLKIDKLNVVDLLVALGQKDVPLQSLHLDTDLTIAAGMGDGVAASDLAVSGTIAAQDLRLQAGAASVTVERIDHTLKSLTLAGVLSPNAAGRDGQLEHHGSLHVGPSAVTIANMGPLNINVRANSADDLDLFFDAIPLPGRPPKSGDLKVKAKLAVNEPKVTLADGRDFSAGLAKLTLNLDDLVLPGLLRPLPERAATRVAISDLVIERPEAHLTRTKDGIALPRPAVAGDAPAAPAPPAANTAANKVVPLAIDLRGLKITRGKFMFVDRVLQPVTTTEIPDFNLSLRRIQSPPLSLDDVRLAITTMGNGTITAKGGLSSNQSGLDLNLTDVVLTPYNPYVAAYSPYRLASGALSLNTKATGAGEKYDVKNHITLANLGLESAETDSPFEKNFGIPLNLALALLQDADGNIALDVPLSIGEAGAAVDVGAVVRSALKAALLGTLSSPLKLIGGFGSGGSAASMANFRPAPLQFHSGRAELMPDAEKAAGHLGEMLKSRPGMAIDLKVAVNKTDVRWLHEQALLKLWGEQSWVGRLGTVFQRGKRDRVRAALEERAADGKGELADEDTAALEQWLVDVPAPTTDELRGLLQSRTALLRQLLEQNAAAAQIVIGDSAPSDETGNASAEVSLRALGAK